MAADLDTSAAAVAAASGSADFDDIDPSPAVASVVDTSVDFDNLAHGQAAPAGAESAGRFEDSDWADHKPVVAVGATGFLVADN